MLKNRKRWVEWLISQDSSLKFQIGERKDWLDYSDMAWQYGSNRTLCHNELVFDIDWKPNNVKNPRKIYPYALRQAIYLEEVLRGFRIPYLRCFSGRLFHYHIFLIPKWRDLIKDYISKEDEDIFRKFKFGLFQYILRFVNKVEYCEFDKGIVSAKAHMIKMIGYLNDKTNNYKNYLPAGLPKEYPDFKYEDIVYPDPKKVIFWRPSPLIIAEVISDIKKEELTGEAVVKNYKSTNKIKWIDEILQMKNIPDGRKRLLVFAIIRYLKNIKRYSNREVITICNSWLRNQGANPEKYKKLIMANINWLDKRLREGARIFPYSKKKFNESMLSLSFLEKFKEASNTKKLFDYDYEFIVDGACAVHSDKSMISCVVSNKEINSEKAWIFDLNKKGTNNQAEYIAVYEAIKLAPENSKILIKSDSALIINQLQSNWAINDPELLRLNNQIKELIKEKNLRVNFKKIEGHNPNKPNLADKEIKRYLKKKKLESVFKEVSGK